MCEVWKDIAGYEDRYQVSNKGNVRSLPRVEIRSDGRTARYPGGPIKPSPHKNSGHTRVNFNSLGKVKTHWVHQLVANAFLPPKPIAHEVCHKNGIPSHNAVSNLEWGTRKKNIEDRRKHGVLVVGEDVIGAKLTELAVIQIRNRIAAGDRVVEIAGEFSVGVGAIYDIKKRRSWSHV